MPAENFLQPSQPQSVTGLALSPEHLTSVFGEFYFCDWFLENNWCHFMFPLNREGNSSAKIG